MTITWDEPTIRRFIEASEYTGYHKALAAKILPYLESDDTLLDIGCGLGRLDIELSQHVLGILAVDTCESAIEAIRLETERLGISNIRTRHGDAEEITDIFDVVLMSFFRLEDTLGFMNRCRSKLIRIVGAGMKSGLYPEKYRRENKNAVPAVKKELDDQGIKYDFELCAIEAGQPLKTRGEAELFVLSNASEADNEEITSFLNERLEETGREDFPLYLPYQKELGIFVINKSNTNNKANSYYQTSTYYQTRG